MGRDISATVQVKDIRWITLEGTVQVGYHYSITFLQVSADPCYENHVVYVDPLVYEELPYKEIKQDYEYGTCEIPCFS